jgi:predicted dehydrogenase
MEPLNLLLVGCGTMGARHVRGYAELERVRPGSLRLRAVCDPRPDAAAEVAAEAADLLGDRPAACRDPSEALKRHREIEAADVVTPNRSHDGVAIPLLEAGLHLLVEKPLGLTVSRGRAILGAAHRSARTLAVAENNRRDPMNRLLQHVCSSGLIGQPHFVIQLQIVSGRGVLGSPWRHSLAEGGLALDIGIHLGYVLEALMGPIETISATSQRIWPEREWRGHGPGSIPAESDDVFAATLTFASGAQGVWAMHFGSVGSGQWQRSVLGDRGTAEGPPDRSGQPVRVRLDGETLEGRALLSRLPGFRLNRPESGLFGERPGSYSYEHPETDRKLIAAEVADFIDAVRSEREPEVPGGLGLRSVAVVYALLESAVAGEPVRVQDVLSGAVHEFQDRVEAGEGDGRTLRR